MICYMALEKYQMAILIGQKYKNNFEEKSGFWQESSSHKDIIMFCWCHGVMNLLTWEVSLRMSVF